MSADLPRRAPAKSLPPRTIGPFSAADLADYADASGDANPLHLDLDFARGFGLRAAGAWHEVARGLRAPAARLASRSRMIGLSGQFLTPVLEGRPPSLTARVAKIEQAKGRFVAVLRLMAHTRDRRPGPDRRSPADAAKG